MAKRLHPDAEGGSDEAFRELQSAYETALEYLIVRQTAFDNVTARASDVSQPRSSQPSQPTPGDSFDPNVHLYYEHTIAAHRRYLNFEGVGYGSTSQRQRQYAIHKLERAFDRVSEYRANKLFDEAATAHEVERKKGKVTEEEERSYEVAKVAMRHQRQAKRKATEARKVEEMIDAAMQEWAAEAPTLSAYGRPFTSSELMTGAGSSQDVLTQRLNKILKAAGYVPEWVELETTIRERYDDAVREVTLKWNSSREVHSLFTRLHPDRPPPPAEHPRYIGYCDHFRPLSLTHSSHVYGDRWAAQAADFLAEVKSINASVVRFNLLVPISSKQRVLYLPLNVLEHVQSHAPDLKMDASEGVSHFSYSNVGHAKVSTGLMVGLGLPMVGILMGMGYLVARHKRQTALRAE